AEDQATVGRAGNARYRALETRDAVVLTPRRYVPDANRAIDMISFVVPVTGAAQGRPAIRREDHGLHRLPVSLEFAYLLAGRQVPQAQGAVDGRVLADIVIAGATERVAAIRRDGDAQHRSDVADHARYFLAFPVIPKLPRQAGRIVFGALIHISEQAAVPE